MATRINITQIANFDIHDESNLAQRRKNGKQSFEFYLTATDTDNDSQMQALLLHCAEPDVQAIFMHLENLDTTYKAAMNAWNNHFEPKKNVVFERQLFRQAIQRKNEPPMNFVIRLCKLPPRVNLPIRIPKSTISSLISARLISYDVVYFKNPILH